MTTRRRVLEIVGFVSAAGLLPRTFAAPVAAAAPPLPEATRAALAESDVVYLTPLKSNGQESRCHGEVWFVHHEGDVYVVTAADAWRSRAISDGLTRARLWVGEFGPWTNTKDKFRAAPGFDASASLETAQDRQDAVLDRFGEKYSMEWLVWGPRFRNGLKDGSRVMLRYEPAVA